MKTDDLIAMLATGAEPVPPNVPEQRVTRAIAFSLPVTLFILLGLGIRPDLMNVLNEPMLWVKFAFPGVVAGISLALMLRLSRPGMPAGKLPRVLPLPAVAMALLATWALIHAAPGERAALVLGSTWQVCTFYIALVGAPVFVGSFWALKGLAPTQLAWAGASAGLLAGAAGAVVYALHCPELDAPFLLVWNGLGMLLPAALGAALGPRLLRW
ncbi:MAG: NrsF family protein [Burkholderiaceae bacterium]